MVVKDNPEANKYIEEFSKVYRYILNNSDKEWAVGYSIRTGIHTALYFSFAEKIS